MLLAALHQATLFTTVCTVAMTVERYELVLEGLALLTMYPVELPHPLQQGSTQNATSPAVPASPPLNPPGPDDAPPLDIPQNPLQVLQLYARNEMGPRVDLVLRREGYATFLLL